MFGIMLVALLSSAIGQSVPIPSPARAVPDPAKLLPPQSTQAVESVEHFIGRIDSMANTKTIVWVLPKELKLDTRELTDGKSLYYTGPPGTYTIYEVAIPTTGTGKPQQFERQVVIKPDAPAPVPEPKPDTVTVPILSGKYVEDAKAIIVAAGLSVGQVSIEPSDTVPIGYVSKQSPDHGAKVAKLSAVSLIVSGGQVPVPPPGPPDPKPPAPGKYAVAPLVYELASKLPADAKALCPAVGSAFATLAIDIGGPNPKVGLLAIAGETRKRLDVAYGPTSKALFYPIEKAAIAKLQPQLKLNGPDIAEAYGEIANGFLAVK